MNSMIKLLIKHKIAEYMISTLFDGVNANFYTNDFITGSQLNNSHVGKKVKRIRNIRNPLMLHTIYPQPNLTIQHDYLSFKSFIYSRNRHPHISLVYQVQPDYMIWLYE